MIKNHKILTFIMLLLFFVSMSWLASCRGYRKTKNEKPRDLREIKEYDTLRVVTMYGPRSYFLYKDNEIGYEYEMAKSLSDAIGVNVKIIVAPDEESMYNAVAVGDADLIAYQMPYMLRYKDKLAYTQKESVTNQVLVQCKSDTMVKDVLDLCGRDVYVRRGSVYDYRLQNLDNEIGGGINICYVPDSLTSEDIIAAVATKKIALTVSTLEDAKLSSSLFSNIDYSVGVSFPQRAAWAVNKESVELLNFINEWSEEKKNQKGFTRLYKRYFEQSIAEAKKIEYARSNGISAYDYLFREYAATLGWDWKLLAAVAYKESKFNPQTISWAGACGLMQLMPKTALSLGVDSVSEMFDPEVSVRIATKYLKKLSKLFPSVTDPDEKIKFTLAAYNSGPAHIIDARALARKYGKDPDVWFGNVEHYILLKSEPEYYTDSVCKYGYCRGIEVVTYVKEVVGKWEEYKSWKIK